MLYLLDSYAWVEYFLGSSKGEIVRNLFLNEKNRFLTVECCLAEIRGWSLRHQKDFTELFKIIRANSSIVSVTEYDWIEAALVRFELRKVRKQFGLIDAVIIVKQKEYDCFIISGDKHFRELKGVLFLG